MSSYYSKDNIHMQRYHCFCAIDSDGLTPPDTKYKDNHAMAISL